MCLGILLIESESRSPKRDKVLVEIVEKSLEAVLNSIARLAKPGAESQLTSDGSMSENACLAEKALLSCRQKVWSASHNCSRKHSRCD